MLKTRRSILQRVALAAIFFLAIPKIVRAAYVKLADTDAGQLEYAGGELVNRGKVWPNGGADPVKYRGSLPAGATGTHCLVAFSGDVERPDRVMEECVLVQFRLDERYPAHAKCGQITTHLRKPFEDGDKAYVLVKTESWDGVQYHVPIHEVRGLGRREDQR